MNTKAEILAWAKNILAKGTGAAPHELLGLPPHAGPTAASDAFMQLARVAHPDLHRTVLTPTEFDQLVLAYSRVAGAYQELRMARPRGTTLAPPARTSSPTAPPMARTGSTTAPPLTLETPAAPPSASASASMNSKALVYFRKAELALNRGDLRGAILQLKMAIAADPQSTMLRPALAEVEAELKKSKG
ncbi:MAG: hypothetical protein SFX73_16160 [Kofleriaceae bacterium]|nr:hypothetical protein [Kofleriaceae bacterium]